MLYITNVKNRNISIKTNWVPRSENPFADELSRYIDHDDWSINHELYLIFEEKWGPHNIDRFATHYNSHCLRFNSKIWCPGTEAFDALNQPWQKDNNWLVLPPNCIAKTVNKIILEQVQGTLIVPELRSAPYWPIIFSNGSFRMFVIDTDYLPCNKVITKGGGKTVFLVFGH